MKYKKWDVVVTNFPYSDIGKTKRRPAVIVSKPFKLDSNIDIYWVLMITSTDLKGVEGDTQIKDLKMAGLPIESIVRPIKIANTENTVITKKIGTLDEATRRTTEDFLLSNLNQT